MSQIIAFQKIVPEGKAMGYLPDGRPVFTIGPLPEEVARVGIRKQRRSYAEAVLHEIVEPSPYRILEAEEHCLICSPWQGVSYKYQLVLKQEMLEEAYNQQHLKIPVTDFIPAPERLGYRNRLDFSIVRINDSLQLAFHTRGSWENYTSLPLGCTLGSHAMNKAALSLVGQLNQIGIHVEPASVTVRHARTTNQLLTILTSAAKEDWSKIDTADLGNFVVARPRQGSGAPGEISYQSGDSFITEQLAGLSFAYPYSSFFQSNISVFERSLAYIIDAASSSHQIVELYCGVGSIGLPLAARGASVRGIETVPEAVEFAELNARTNNIAGYSAEAVAAENMDSSILINADCVIVDPPRAGLHPRVVSWILEARPKQLLYLSCNPVTQARDIGRLQSAFVCDSLIGFDFYPGTLHLEALATLQLKQAN